MRQHVSMSVFIFLFFLENITEAGLFLYNIVCSSLMYDHFWFLMYTKKKKRSLLLLKQ